MPWKNPLTAVLHEPSKQLRSLHLTWNFLLSPQLFWPDMDAASESPSWPHMERILIEDRRVAPEGWCYFERSWTEIRIGRTYVQSQTSDWSMFSRLMTQVSRALLRMPKLEGLTIAFNEHDFEFDRKDPRKPFHYKPALALYSFRHPGGSPWEPFPPVHSHFQDPYNWRASTEILGNWNTLCQVVAMGPLRTIATKRASPSWLYC